MQTTFQKFKRIVLVLYIVAIHLALAYFVGERLVQKYVAVQPVDTELVTAPAERTPIPTPLPVPETFADPPDGNVNTELSSTATPGLMIPVAGVKPEHLLDTFSDARSEGRYHDSIDIPAPAGTPVIAAADGEIARFWDSDRGGITVYQFTADRRFMLYYAHLQRRADGIAVGMSVKKGATIGYVGDTGNATPGNYHLHFSVSQITDPKRFWEGTPLNPYPLLKKGLSPQLP